ncbi:hypothetical protein HDV06_000860 [Boothiomyces sp. JEL0866]|nr:hypothetical protein HDV06_000860 [Boothiomyces sp. JEL0866]
MVNAATYWAAVAEIVVAIVNVLLYIPYYWNRTFTVISYHHILFGLFFLANTIVTMYLISIDYQTSSCLLLNLQGYTKNLAEVWIDWIFTLRVYYLERNKFVQFFWIGMYTALDVIPRIVSLAMYQDTMHSNGICTLLDPNGPRIIKTVMNTVYIGIVGCYFIYRMIQVIRGVGTSQQLESLTVTSGMYAIMLCLTRTVFYIPYILNTWPPITGILVPIQLCILPPLCFLNIIYGAKLKIRSTLTNKSRSRTTSNNEDITSFTSKAKAYL